MKKAKEPTTIREFFLDDAGLNKIVMHQTDKTTVLFLKLQSENGRKRKVGVITKSTETMKIKRSRDKHLFRKFSAYGFNEYVLQTAKSFNKIWLADEHDEWKIPVDFILKNGEHFLHFKEQGFELQRFITLSQIEQFRVRKEENRRF